jgi:hypothetical protein
MGCTVAELERRMSGAELREWATFFRYAPECARPEYGVAQICALLANLFAKPPAGEKAWHENQFLPDERLRRLADPEWAAREDAMKVWRQFEVMEGKR